MNRIGTYSGMGVIGRIFFVLAAGTLCFFVMLGLFGMAQSKLTASPVSSMKGLAASVSSQFFKDMIGMEVPHFNNEHQKSTFSQKHIISFLFQFLIDINPADPKSLIAREVPGMGNDDATLLRRGLGNDYTKAPADYVPSAEDLKPDPKPGNTEGTSNPDNKQQGTSEGTNGTKQGTDEGTNEGAKGTEQGTDEGTNQGTNQGSSKGTGGAATEPPHTDPQPNTGTTPGIKPAAKGEKVVFIYHSHNRESWVPELKDKGVKSISQAFDSKINITLLGQRLADQLGGLGIGALDSNVDYPSVVPNYNWNFSYKYSSTTVKEAYAAHHELLYYFDIHRDSQERKLTTIKINGLDYAQLYFIIGHKNPNWEKNEQFAKKIHEKLDKLYPGLSRGIWTKTASSGQAEYNQSFSPNSILIEVGGPENTIKESYRTIDKLAQVIADIYREAEKVNSPAATVKKKSQL